MSEQPPVVITTPSTMPELSAVADLINGMWESELVVGGLLRAVQHAGGYVAAVHVDGELVGGSIAFLGQHDGATTLHSHITGVRTARRGIGTLVKAHQRDWCRQRGITAITWTFDPLVARNAYFNLHKLRATAIEYLPDHYGQMTDAINAGDRSDRFGVRWPVDDTAKPAEDHADPVLLLDRSDEHEPVPLHTVADAHGAPIALRIHPDIEALRTTDPAAAFRWRDASRSLFIDAFAAGYQATDMTRDGCYLLTKEHYRP